MSVRLPIRSRVLKTDQGWLVVLPSGRRALFRGWSFAMSYAYAVVAKERHSVTLQDEVRRRFSQ